MNLLILNVHVSPRCPLSGLLCANSKHSINIDSEHIFLDRINRSRLVYCNIVSHTVPQVVEG